MHIPLLSAAARGAGWAAHRSLRGAPPPLCPPATHYGGHRDRPCSPDLYATDDVEAFPGCGDRLPPLRLQVFTRPSFRRAPLRRARRHRPRPDAIADFRFDDADLRYSPPPGALREDTLDHLAQHEFTGDVFGYQEGELFFPNSPVLRIEGTFENAVMLETVVLSILNHDSGVASVGSRMVTAARGRPLDERWAAARARSPRSPQPAPRTWSALQFEPAAGAHYRIPAAGTSAHAFTLLFDSEEDARAQLTTQGAGTTALVDTYDVESAVRTAVEIAGPGLGAVWVDLGRPGPSRPDACGSCWTRSARPPRASPPPATSTSTGSRS